MFSLALFALFLISITNAHRTGSGHRHNHNRFNQASADQQQQQQQSASEENGVPKQPENNGQTTATSTALSNADNYIKFTEFMHLNFSHSKQFSGLPATSNPAISDASSFDPFAALRQLLPAFPAPNWNTWTQVQSTAGRMGLGGNQPTGQLPIQLPNIVPMSQTNVGGKPQQNEFNNNYNYNFGKNNVDRFGVDLTSHGNSPATTGFPGTANLKGFKPTEKSIIADESGERLTNEKATGSIPRPKRPNSKSMEKLMEKSSERPALPQRNITAYWIF